MSDTAAAAEPQGLRTKPMPVKPEWLKAQPLATGKDASIGVDRENKVIRGYVVAQEGPFKDLRGEFDLHALQLIRDMLNAAPKGLKSRLGHPTMSDDGVGRHLGRAFNARLDTIQKTNDDGTRQSVHIVRADLHLDPTSFHTPHGDLGTYVLDRAESDPDSFSSSLVLQTDQEYRTDSKGRALTDQDGNPLPPLWRPIKLHASDVVDTGDAVDSFLAVDALPDAAVRLGAELLDRQFADCPREVVKARALAWLDRYLNHRFGPEEKLDAPGYAGDGHEAEPGGQAISAYQCGDRVGFLQEHLQHHMAVEKCGRVLETSTGTLKIPGTNLSRTGSVDEPVALVREEGRDDDGDGDDDRFGNGVYHLVAYPGLRKLAEEESDGPGEGRVNPDNAKPGDGRPTGSAGVGGLSPEDEGLLLDIQLRLMESAG